MDIALIKGHLNRMYSELESGIDSLDDDDQIFAVVVMKLVQARVEDINKLLGTLEE